jgi:hypothetical protein
VKPWKSKKFFGDLVYDLRNRNLLLVVLMLVVAIVAVPLLVSNSGSGNAPGPLDLGAQTSAGSSPETENAVVAYHPGVRNFKSRLKDLSAKDPFKEQFAPATAGAPSLDQSASSTSSTSSSVSVTGGGGSSGGGGSHTGSGTTTKTETRYSYFVTNVAVGESGGTLTALNGISQFQFLPSQDKPVLVYLGTSSGGTQALFLVSKDVSGVGGNGTCFPTADDCQLLGLNSGAGADLVYGPDGKTYHLQVTKIKRVTSAKPPA